MPLTSSHFAQARYDEVAPDYDRLWTQHMEGPQARLTAGLALRPGDQLADVACGTGVITLDMARRTRPGAVVAVDYSVNMLEAARERLALEGIPLRLVHAEAQRFVEEAEPESFDVISCRFALAYFDWRSTLPRIGRLLRPGGRVGILNSLSSSIPQGFQVYERLRESPRSLWRLLQHFRKDVKRGWSLYKRLRQTFGTTSFITVPDSPEQVAALLAQGGLERPEAWSERVRLWFRSGREVVDWVDASGYATHPGLQHVDGDGIRFLKAIFAEGLEDLREPGGVPLDIAVSGVVARRAP